MVNGENASSMLFTYCDLYTNNLMSVFNYPLTIPLSQYSFNLFFSYFSPPQPAGCVTATPLLLLLSQNLLRHFVNPDKSGPNQKRRLMQLLVINQFIFEGLFSRLSKSWVTQFDRIVVWTP